jgi:hypothetical protein
MKAIRIVNNLARVLFAASALALSGAAFAQSITFQPTTATPYSNVGFFQNIGGSLDSFEVTAAGIYRATLIDFKFPGSFSGDFGLNVGNDQLNVLGSTTGPGSFTFQAAPGTYWAYVFGETSGRLDLGLYGIRIEQVMAAPLPGAMLFLVSALVVLFGAGRGGIRIGKREPDVPFGAAMA